MTKKNEKRGEVLVALLKEKSDFAILQEQCWYRIPVASAPKRWPPQWLAFYQPKAFEEEPFRVQRYGEVAKIEIVCRRDLFPNEFENTKSDWPYYKLSLKKLELLDKPIISKRGRRLIFIPTTWDKFSRANQINDLFDDSPLEDALWEELQRLEIPAERQWELITEDQRFFLDFALFCNKAPIAIETDGDTYHINMDRANADYIRQNAIESRGWHVLRFNTSEIREKLGSYCIPEIMRAINHQDGLLDGSLVPSVYYPKSNAKQLSLFEKQGVYRTVDISANDNLEL